MTKKLMRSLVPVMALSLAVGLFTGCSGGGDEETTAAAAGTEAAGGDAYLRGHAVRYDFPGIGKLDRPVFLDHLPARLATGKNHCQRE